MARDPARSNPRTTDWCECYLTPDSVGSIHIQPPSFRTSRSSRTIKHGQKAILKDREIRGEAVHTEVDIQAGKQALVKDMNHSVVTAATLRTHNTLFI